MMSRMRETKVMFVFLKKICARSSICVAQTSYLQTVCFFDGVIKKRLRELFLVQTWPNHF
ncbi:hypothetical protein Hanom_Chr11g01031911 [Helianthus anomalus]